jgi:hypothetical protein
MKLYHGDRAEQHIVRKRGAFVDAYMKPRNQNRQRKKTCPNSHIRKRKVAFSKTFDFSLSYADTPPLAAFSRDRS